MQFIFIFNITEQIPYLPLDKQLGFLKMYLLMHFLKNLHYCWMLLSLTFGPHACSVLTCESVKLLYSHTIPFLLRLDDG